MLLTQASELREHAVKLAKEIDRNYFELGRILSELTSETVLHGGKPVYLYELWGYGTRFEWAEVELGMHTKPARTCQAIYERFGVALQGKWDPNKLLSRTKMRALLRVVKPRSSKAHINQWLDRAAGLSVCSLEHTIEEALKGHTQRKTNYTVQLTPSQRQVLERGIAAAFEANDQIKTRGDALEMIVNEWLAHHEAVKKVRRAS